jgi:hypothetical protein
MASRDLGVVLGTQVVAARINPCAGMSRTFSNIPLVKEIMFMCEKGSE